VNYSVARDGDEQVPAAFPTTLSFSVRASRKLQYFRNKFATSFSVRACRLGKRRSGGKEQGPRRCGFAARGAFFLGGAARVELANF
jgi:hypothetical protein